MSGEREASGPSRFPDEGLGPVIYQLPDGTEHQLDRDANQMLALAGEVVGEEVDPLEDDSQSYLLWLSVLKRTNLADLAPQLVGYSTPRAAKAQITNARRGAEGNEALAHKLNAAETSLLGRLGIQGTAPEAAVGPEPEPGRLKR